MSRQCLLALASLVAMAICLKSAGSLGRAEDLPGVAVPDLELDDTIARGCGQFCTTHGQSICTVGVPPINGTPSNDCMTSGFYPFAPCAAPGAQCGTCWGAALDQACYGDLRMSGELCYLYPEGCCTPPYTCTTIIDATGGTTVPIRARCVCGFSNVTNKIAGKRVRCSIDVSYSGCRAGG